MASTLAVPLQLVVLGADALFAMHARLRQEVTGPDAVPVAKCDTSTLGPWGLVSSRHCVRCVWLLPSTHTLGERLRGVWERV